MKSVWESLAEMTPEGREKFLKRPKKHELQAKTDKKTIGNVVYSTTTCTIPEEGIFGTPGFEIGE